MCYHSYDRLIDLAKRTGDRLIVHDPIEGRDMVIMDVDEYEKILDNGSKGDFGFESRKGIRNMSSEQMLDQINRDIAIWRAEKEDEEEWERDMALENELEDEVPFDPFAEQDYHPADWHTHPEDLNSRREPWHSTGSVLGDRYSEFDNDEFKDEDDWEDEDEDSGFDFNMDDWNMEVANDFNSDLLKEEKKVDDEIRVEDIPFDIDFSKIEDLKIDIPFLNQDLEGEDWNEEPLDSDDEPVFYEEPV